MSGDSLALQDAHVPEAVRFLSLDASGLLEASAGSGKTYAIEHLVVRLLKEKPEIALSGILLVTFTDKAAGELKEKIRRRLQSEAQRPGINPGIKYKLEQAHLHFDQAAVHTIHGFCLQVLKRYAFENRGLFEIERSDDKAVLQEALLLLRRRMARGGGETALVEGLLKTSTATAEKDLLSYAYAFRVERGDSLWPAPDPEKWNQAELNWTQIRSEIRQYIISKEGEPLSVQPWYQAFAQAHKTKTKLNPFQNSLETLFDLCAGGESISIGKWRSGLIGNKTKLQKNPEELFAAPENGFAGEAKKVAEALPTLLRKAVDAVKDLELAEVAKARSPIWHLLQALAQAVIEIKLTNGSISYDDMMGHLWKALDRNSELVALLRRQFRYAIVDEFQDTDPVQWAIFKHLFLDSEGQNPLYLVGDPKQAIYGFRGGDLQTYLAARKRLEELSQSGKAKGTRLESNFRSRADLIEALNLTFAQPTWFKSGSEPTSISNWNLPASGSAIAFLPSHFGNSPRQRYLDHLPHPEPVILCEIEGDKVDERQQACAQFAAGLLRELLNQPQCLMIPDGEERLRPIHAGDICVLVQSHKDKIPFERAFRKARIPYSIYKQGGLFQSDEAGHLLTLLEAWLEPSDISARLRVALSRFGLTNPKKILSEGSKAEVLTFTEGQQVGMETLRALALQGKWSRVFQGLFHQHRLFVKECLMADAADRISRWRQIAQIITREARLHGLDLEELIRRIKSWRRLEMPPGDEIDLQRNGQSTPKVLLLTLHASKGLEFPVVFLGYSSKLIEPSKPLRERDESGLGWRIHLSQPNPEISESLQREAVEEYKRLYYVALTRAQFKLFIPLPISYRNRDDQIPLTSFVGNSLRTACANSTGLFAKIKTPWVISVQAEASNNGSETGLAEPSPKAPNQIQSNQNLDLASESSAYALPLVMQRRRRLTSYSSLALKHKELWITPEGKRLLPDELNPEENSEEDTSANFNSVDLVTPVLMPGEISENSLSEARKEVDKKPVLPELPRGAGTGNLLHGLLENMDFTWVMQVDTVDDFGKGPIQGQIQKQALRYGLDEKFYPSLVQTLWNTLRTPLPDAAGGNSFCLGDVSQRFAELEFLMPFAGHEFKKLPPETRLAGGYIWGYIDLVFRWKGRVYLLDWKSNYLDEYSTQALTLSITREAYDLQYRLYAIAVHRWLQSRLPNYQYENDFGGIYYLYLRGMNTQSETGIFHYRPTAQELNIAYPLYLTSLLGIEPQAWAMPNTAFAFNGTDLV